MLEQKIADILKKDIESLGCLIWGIEISGGSFSKNIVIYIDKKDDLITLEDCENVNIQAREVLDNFSELSFNFSLEISSPGIDRKFFNINQLKDYLGETINLSCF
jgi:ribosome maturation factor RimP